MILQNIFVRSLRAESIKLRGTPMLWLVLAGGIFIAGFIFLIHFFNVEKFAGKSGSPWKLYFELSFMMTSMLFLVPFVVLLAGAIVFPEHRGNVWKKLYTLPLQKSNVYFSKLLTLLGLIGLTFIIFFVCGILGAYLLDLIYPAYGFRVHSPGIANYAMRLLHAYLSVLGVVGLHYWLSVRWSSFIVPMGIGLLGFIVATALIFIGNRFDLGNYFPYAYPMIIGAEFGTKPQGLPTLFGLSSVEWFSVGLLILFSLVGYLEEKSKNVK